MTRILLVDDDDLVRRTLATVLRRNDFDVTTSSNVLEALKLISFQTFDVLLSDLHMPDAGDGLTIVSAMRHANPAAITILLSAFPEMTAASQAILMQVDEILIKPMDVASLVAAINHRIDRGPLPARPVEAIAEVLERSADLTIEAWFKRVEKEQNLHAPSMNRDDRTRHLPHLLADISQRLRSNKPLGSKDLVSAAAREHGRLRRRQLYSADMMVEESRLLQVSIFETLQRNLTSLDFSVLLQNVMTIADEVDSQLAQAMQSYVAESLEDALPA